MSILKAKLMEAKTHEQFTKIGKPVYIFRKTQRKYAFERAKNKCEICGTEGDLNLVKTIKREYFKDQYGYSFIKRHCAENQLVVCRPCGIKRRTFRYRFKTAVNIIRKKEMI